MSPSQNQTRIKSRRGPPRATTARQQPYAGLAISLLLHAGLIGATYLTWHRMLSDVSEESHAVPVDLITVAKVTNIAPQAPPEKFTLPKPDETPPAPPKLASLEPSPEPPVPQIKIKPDQTDSDQTDKADSKSTAKDFNALLNKLSAPATPPKNAKSATRTVQGIGAQNMMTADLGDALKSQIYQCWNVQAITGAPNPADLVVEFDVHLNRNGTVASAGMTGETIARAAVNPYTRAAAEAASRAIYQCQGQGYRLPPERYDQWSEINPLRFDPRQMLNQ